MKYLYNRTYQTTKKLVYNFFHKSRSYTIKSTILPKTVPITISINARIAPVATSTLNASLTHSIYYPNTKLTKVIITN